MGLFSEFVCGMVLLFCQISTIMPVWLLCAWLYRNLVTEVTEYRRYWLDLNQLPLIEVAEHDEVMTVLERHRLWGRGLTWIDLHLLTSARLSGVTLWTRDKALASAWQLLRRQ